MEVAAAADMWGVALAALALVLALCLLVPAPPVA